MSAGSLERGLWLAAHTPRSAAFLCDGVLYLALEPTDELREHDPALALERFADRVERWRDPRLNGMPCAFGWLAYDALRGDEPGSRDDVRPRGDRAPLAYLARYDAVLAVDLRDGVARAHPEGSPAAAALLRAWDRAADARLPAPLPARTESATDARAHRAAVDRVREAIFDGEVYLVNVARVVHAPGGLERPQLAARVLASRAPYLALLDAGEACVGGMSMELALAWDRASGVLATRPIKGTRPRGRDAREDALLRDELLRDPKERAENVMALDVHRNDLGRVAAPASVRVTDLCAAETHAFVHHLVSGAEAVARAGVSAREVLGSVLPAGSVTGAPKRSAMEAIARVEAERRGVYTGAYGALRGDGSFTLAVAIRTLVCDGAGAHYGAGGGIVADSDPEREWLELSWKERALAGG